MAEAQTNLHEEIAHLEAQLAAKKQEAIVSGTETPEPELFKAVIREHASIDQPSVSIPVSAPAAAAPARTATPAEQQKIKNLIALSFTKGIAAAVTEAKKSNDPYLIDLLHDQLADEYYQKLLTLRQVKQI